MRDAQTIGALIADLLRARQHMGRGNPHRLLFLNAEEAVTQLALRLHDVEVGCRTALTHGAAWEKLAASLPPEETP